MSFTALLLPVTLWFAGVASSEGPPPVLDPAHYESPSGEYVLHIDPTDKHGAGSGDYTLRRDGALVFTTRLPFTFWDAVVTDDGRAAGYAYTNGYRDHRVEGKFLVAILAPDGEIAFEESVARTGSRFLHTAPDPKARGLFFHPDLGRVVVRVSDPDVNRRSESWWSYDLEQLTRISTVEPKTLLEDKQGLSVTLDAMAVPGTPLTLAHWYRVDYPRLGARFVLHDENYAGVWQLDLPDDYSIPDDDAQMALLREMWETGAILETGPTRFEVRIVRESERLLLAVEREPAHSGGWAVTEIARSPFTPAEPEPESAPIEKLELSHIETVGLGERPRERVIRDIEAFDVGADGSIHFIRREHGERVYSAVVVDGSGTLIRETTFDPLTPGAEGSVLWEPLVPGEWLVTISPFGDEQTSIAWRTEGASTRLVPLTEYACPSVEALAPSGDGGFVVLATRRTKHQLFSELYACAANGRPYWRDVQDNRQQSDIFSPQDLTVTEDGSVVVLDNIRDEIQVFAADGELVETVDLPEAWNQKPNYLAEITSDANGGLVIHDFNGEPPIWRMSLDGTVRGTLEPRYADGSTSPELSRGIRVAPDGHLWTSDRSALLRLNDEGIVDLIVGRGPDAATLDQPGHAFLDHLGRVLIQDQRNAAVHVYDRSGSRLMVCEADPTDFPDGADRTSHLAVSGDGRVYVQTTGDEYLEFDPEGSRRGTLTLGLDVQFIPGSSSWWQRPNYSGAVQQCDSSGAVEFTIDRRPDRTWLRHPNSYATTADGSVAIFERGMFNTQDASARVALYGPDGSPEQLIVLPEVNRAHFLAYNREWIALCGGDGALHLVQVATDPVCREVVGLPHIDGGGLWIPQFSPDGRELWLLDAQARQLHRFALPAGK